MRYWWREEGVFVAILIRPISYSELVSAPNAAEILAEYSGECSLPELGDACPHDATYLAVEKSGGMRTFGVYDGDTLVGFSIVLIYIQPHYGKKVATTESIFISQSYRHTGAGKELMNMIEQYAKEQGCIVFLYAAPVGSRFAKMLALNIDRYRRTNVVYLRNLA